MLKKKMNVNPTPDLSANSTLVSGKIPGSHYDALMDDLDRHIQRTNSRMRRTGFEDPSVPAGAEVEQPPKAAQAVNKSTVERWTGASRRIAGGKKKGVKVAKPGRAHTSGEYPRWQGGNQ